MNPTTLHQPGEIVQVIAYKDKYNFTVYLGVIREFTWAMAKDGSSSFVLEGFYKGLKPIKCTFVNGQAGDLSHTGQLLKYPIKGVDPEMQQWHIIKQTNKQVKVTSTGTFVTYGDKGKKPYVAAVVGLDEVKKKLTRSGLRTLNQHQRTVKQYTLEMHNTTALMADTLKDLNDQIKHHNLLLIPVKDLYNKRHDDVVVETVRQINSLPVK